MLLPIICFTIIGFLSGFIAAVYLAIYLDNRHSRNLASTVMNSLVDDRSNVRVIKHPSTIK